MGKNKRRTKYDRIDSTDLVGGLDNLRTSQSPHKRFEEKTTNNNNNKNNVKMNQGEDKIEECSKPLIEGTKAGKKTEDLDNLNTSQTPYERKELQPVINEIECENIKSSTNENISFDQQNDDNSDHNNKIQNKSKKRNHKNKKISHNNTNTLEAKLSEKKELQPVINEIECENIKSSSNENNISFDQQSDDNSDHNNKIQNKSKKLNHKNKRTSHNTSTLEAKSSEKYLKNKSWKKNSISKEKSFEKLTSEDPKSNFSSNTSDEQNCSDYIQKHYQGKNHDKKQKSNKHKYSKDEFSTKIKDEEKCDLKEIDQDLFELPKEYALAHCVAEDLRMGAGIAVKFKNDFGGVGKLFDQKLKVGDVGIVNRHEQNVFYLVTKSKSSGKPTMGSLERTLKKLLEEMKKRKLTKLGIPTIGCGLDALDWSNVKSLIMDIFAGSGIHISVCIPSKVLAYQMSSPPLKVFFAPNNLWEMQPETDMIIFIDIDTIQKNNWTIDVVDKVNAKYPFKENLLKDIKMKELKPGDIKQYNVKNEIIICAFVKSSENYYTSVEKAFKNIKRLKLKSYRYLAIQSNLIQSDDTFNHISRIVLILRSIITNSEFWLCGDTNQKYHSSYDDYCRNRRQDYPSKYYSNSWNRTSYKHNYNSSSYNSKGDNQNCGSFTV